MLSVGLLLACPEGIEPPTHSLEGRVKSVYNPHKT